MIFPFLDGFARFSRARVTWLLVLLNAVVMIGTHQLANKSQVALEKLVADDYFRDSQGRVYSQFIRNHAAEYSPLMNQLSHKALQGDAEKISLLGTMAIRDSRFLNLAPSSDFAGDQISIEVWKATLRDIQEVQSRHPSYMLGLRAEDMSPSKWLSYIFVHSGGVHFFGNMIFLIIFGCALEPLIGGLSLLIVFLLSGIVAAGTFVLMTGSTAAPLIGASGSVSGLMALFACLYWHRAVRFIYWLYLPFRGFAGYVFLPGWVVLAMWFVSDLAGYLGTLTEFGGVAYAAHLGGELTGVAVGLAYYILGVRLFKSAPEIEMPQNRIGELVPFDQAYAVKRPSLQAEQSRVSSYSP